MADRSEDACEAGGGASTRRGSGAARAGGPSPAHAAAADPGEPEPDGAPPRTAEPPGHGEAPPPPPAAGTLGRGPGGPGSGAPLRQEAVAGVAGEIRHEAGLARKLRQVAREMMRLADEVDRLSGFLRSGAAEEAAPTPDEDQLLRLLLAAQRGRAEPPRMSKYAQLLDLLYGNG
jgi:hypothetical protein